MIYGKRKSVGPSFQSFLQICCGLVSGLASHALLAPSVRRSDFSFLSFGVRMGFSDQKKKIAIIKE